MGGNKSNRSGGELAEIGGTEGYTTMVLGFLPSGKRVEPRGEWRGTGWRKRGDISCNEEIVYGSEP